MTAKFNQHTRNEYQYFLKKSLERINKLYTITNMPINRFEAPRSKNKFNDYMNLLKITLEEAKENVMCKSMISITLKVYTIVILIKC